MFKLGMTQRDLAPRLQNILWTLTGLDYTQQTKTQTTKYKVTPSRPKNESVTDPQTDGWTDTDGLTEAL